MRDRSDEIRRLAELAVDFGANLQPGQILGIQTYTGMQALTRAVARVAYERGARYVDAVYFDLWVKRERIAGAPDDSLGEVPPWLVDRLEWLSEQHAARVTFTAPEPGVFDGLDATRAGRDLMPYLPNTGSVVNRRTTNWNIIPSPTPRWAQAVYPDLAPEEAYERLWDAIVHICRLDEADPAAAWTERMETLKSVAGRISERRFDKIRFHGDGTDLSVGLFGSSAWHAAEFDTVDGLSFYPNLPSEEMFTTPDPARTEGYVTATLPKELYGSLIEGIRLEFEGGRVTRVDADRGADALRSVVSRDEGASHLGEVALVDGAGRIGALGTVFFDTLLDENAASHIALGNGYELTVLDPAERAWIARSEVHADVMIGSPELHVDGITESGETVPLLRGGNWQI